MHQRANAQVLADAGAAVLIDDQRDAKKNAARLRPALTSLLYEQTKRQALGDAARKLGKANAADAVAEIVMKMTSGAEDKGTRGQGDKGSKPER